MSMGLLYKGGFYSYSDTLYEVEIYQEGYSGAVETISFTDEPLVIEWAETDKLEPVQSANATLQLYSDSDRRFVDLYTIEAGSVRMDVYREGALYWSGTLDPELYEEPFAYLADYGVELTFADMAILDRLSWTATGFMTLREVITTVLTASGIQYGEIEEHISTKLSATGTENLLDAVSVNLANFYDEDGEPMTMREVLDETLRPFALRLIQKGGKVVLYDLNDLYASPEPETVAWDADDSTLGVDKVYNNVKVTFSPYEETEMLKGEVDPESVPSDLSLSVRVDYAEDPRTGALTSPVGFNIDCSHTGKGMELSRDGWFYHINPVLSGEESAGVAWTITTINFETDGQYRLLNQPSAQTGNMLFRVPLRPYVFNVGEDRSNYRLKIELGLLFDPRYNPFEDASEDNEQGNWDNLSKVANIAYVPIILTLRDEEGNALLHLQNNSVKESSSYGYGYRSEWSEGEGSWGGAWLCWYEDDREKSTGLGGWKTNKRIIGKSYTGKLPVLYSKTNSGDYINLPPKSGYLELQVGQGVPIYHEGETNNALYQQCRWVLYKEPVITLVDSYGQTLQTEDIEHSAWLNRAAKEDLSIDTVLGTLDKPSPIAKGQLFKTADLSVISEFYRAGVTDQIERLLIGTVYSNYASRHNTLSGTVELLPSFGTYTDTNEPGRYLLLSETQNLREEQSEIVMAQFDMDNYEGVEFADETV